MTMKSVTAEELRALWQDLPTDTVFITAGEMRAKAEAFQRRMRRRNLTEYAACALVILVFGWYATFSEPATPLWPLANGLIILASIFAAFRLHQRGRAEPVPVSATVATLLDFQRAELKRQRDLLVTAWRWYVLPFLPGLVLFFVSLWIGRAPGMSETHLIFVSGVTLLIVLLVIAGVLIFNLTAAVRLQRRIDDFDRYKELE